MTPKYQPDDPEVIGSLSSQQNIITRRSPFIIGTEKIENYDAEELQASQLNYFTPDHTHYCLNCKEWYPKHI
jgi:hypothetical protein